MAIIAMSINRIEASSARPDDFSGQIMVNSTPVIKGMSEKKLDLPGIDTAILADFDFVTTYEPKLGQIKMSGEILFSDVNSKKILDEWKKNKKIMNEVGVPLMNAIFRRCLSRVLWMAEDLQLPPPIVFPTVVPTEAVKAAEKEMKEKEHKKK